jgi:hypothetical protein
LEEAARLDTLAKQLRAVGKDASAIEAKVEELFSNAQYLEREANLLLEREFATKIRVYRVEGTPNTRIVIGKDGSVAILGDQPLFLNFGSEARAQRYFAQKVSRGLPDVQTKSFEVPKEFLDELRSSAVPERLGKTFPDRPILVDVSKAPDQFGLRPDQIEALKKVILAGTGK